MITKKESGMIERVLKTSLQVIYQNNYISFQHALARSKMKSLSQRRKDLIFKFSQKAGKSIQYSDWFVKVKSQQNTRRAKPRFKPVPCRTTRFQRSALPAMSLAVSWHPPLTYISPTVY